MSFADDFRESAIPRLRESARVQAFFVALGLIELEEARAVVAGEARKAGSALLRTADQDKLEAWIANTLWAEAEKATDRVIVLEMRADEAERDDPVRYYDGLAKRCANAEAMRWTFAAISKPYRDHLLREKRQNGR